MRICAIDIHNHLLPGVDDGFQDAGHSVEAIKKMAGAGCLEFVFTPHVNPELYPDSNEESLKRKYEEFSKLLPSGVKTSLAAEYMVVKDFEKKVASQADKLLHYRDGSILIEMSYYFRSPNLERVVFELNMAGLRPIIAHPERYPYMVDCLEDFDSLYDNGCRFQINYLSLTGAYGPASIRILKYLQKKGMCDFFSSDVHSLAQLEKILDGKIIFPLRKLCGVHQLDITLC